MANFWDVHSPLHRHAVVNNRSKTTTTIKRTSNKCELGEAFTISTLPKTLLAGKLVSRYEKGLYSNLVFKKIYNITLGLKN